MAAGVSAEFSWEQLPDMPTARCYSVAAYHEKNIYVFGGCDKEGHPLKVAEVYNLDSRVWSALPPMPRNRAACNKAIVRANKIYLVGGTTDKQKPIAHVDCFDIATRQWSEVEPLPIGVIGPYLELIDDKLYCLGGTDKSSDRKDCNQCVMFDFEQGVWLPLPPKPTPCYACGGYLHERKLYIVGGRHGKTPVKEVESFDLDTHTWEKHASMASVRVFYNIVGIKDEIYVVGGLVPMIGVSKIVEKYSIHDDMWSRITDLKEARSDAACGVVGGRMIIAGGLGGEKLSAMNTAQCIKHRGRKFEPLPNLSRPRSSLTSLAFEGKLAVINGVGVDKDGKPLAGGVTPAIEVLSCQD